MEKYDLIIIGAGCSGLSAAMYGTRLGLKTLTLGELPGGLITTTHLVENWPGVKSISGPDLAMSLYDHAQSAGAEIKSEKVSDIKNLSDGDNLLFEVTTGGNVYQSKTVLIATGTEHKKLGVKGEKEFEHKGVSFCALCDGAFFKGKVVGVVGGGDSAAKEALFLSEHAEKVFLIVRKDILRAEPINIDRIKANGKIEIVYNTEVEEVFGGEKMEGIVVKGSGEKIMMDGIFVAIGHTAQTGLAKNLGVALNAREEIMIDRKSATNVKGVFAAGDCCDTEFKQAITGSAEAVTASYFAYLTVN
ncbi:thioredoxin-disulfide reductase [Candidatus Peregrinibacteria bacterium HGW-Peregrinibacteria-1]|jgi:thioredoxin reductase (NADPH)|nr:MAG: thioredoxin-disulfide reductase [Candidatus Peregrinibacteria bacterium HGW-Peregrinibacteria-1]